MSAANLHSTTGFGHHQASRKSILTSHLEKNENHWFQRDKTFVLSCSVPKAVVDIDNIVMNRTDMFSFSMELTIYLWSKH